MAIKKRRRFTAEIKREAVKSAQQLGRSLTAVTREIGVERSVLKRWVENFDSGQNEKDSKLPLKLAQQEELARLRREVRRSPVPAAPPRNHGAELSMSRIGDQVLPNNCHTTEGVTL